MHFNQPAVWLKPPAIFGKGSGIFARPGNVPSILPGILV
jgi:hypothetical protein